MKTLPVTRFLINSVLFVLVAIPGFILALGAAIEFCSTIIEKQSNQEVTQIRCAVIWIISSFLMLFGVRKWGYWMYLYVFLSIPLTLCMTILFIPSGNKFTPAIITGITYWAILLLVQNHYKNRKQQKQDCVCCQHDERES